MFGFQQEINSNNKSQWQKFKMPNNWLLILFEIWILLYFRFIRIGSIDFDHISETHHFFTFIRPCTLLGPPAVIADAEKFSDVPVKGMVTMIDLGSRQMHPLQNDGPDHGES